jgi:predicted ABC-type ATPase
MSAPSDQKIQDKAVEYAKSHRKSFAKQFTDPGIYIPEENPVSVFMAGSPGAGKTEASLELIARIVNGASVLRIDPDDLRTEFEDYNGTNAYLFQRAVSIFVDCILDRAFRRNQSFILDGTLSSYESAKKNIDRSLDKKRMVQILYVYQLPHLAWQFVQDREYVEGRRILPETFINQYFASREVVNRLKVEYGNDIKVDLLMKNNDNSHRFFEFGVDCIDPFIPERYTRAGLEQTILPMVD